MKTTLTRTYTQSQIDSHSEDELFDYDKFLFAYEELIEEFLSNNPGVIILSSGGGTINNGDGTHTSSITITY